MCGVDSSPMPSSRDVTRATALIVLSSCSFGSLTTLTVFVRESGLSILPAMLWRYLLAAVVLATIVRRSAITSIGSKQALRLLLIGGCGQAVITYVSLLALDYLPVGALAFLFYTYPAWVAVMAAITGRDALTATRLIALVVAMSGIAVMIGAPSAASLNTTGVLIALGSAILFALYLPALNEAQRGIPPLVSTFYLVTGVSLSFLLAGVFTRTVDVPPSLSSWALVAGLALVSTVIAFVSLIAGLRILGPLRTSIIGTTEPFFTAVLGIVLLRERPTLATFVGGAMIAGAVLLLQWKTSTQAEVESAS